MARAQTMPKEDKWVKTVCLMCQNCCPIVAHVEDGVVTKLEGNPESPHSLGRMCAKGNAGLIGLYDPNRITKPMKRTNPEKGIGVDPCWVEISYDEAMDIICAKLDKIRREDPRKLLVDMFDTQSFFPLGFPWFAAFGTPNITAGPAGFFCGNGYHNVTLPAHGTFFAEPDYDHCNYLLLIGSSNGFLVGTNPIGLARLTADARSRGMKVVVVDPVCSHAASKADDWIPIRPGTDAAFALAMLNLLLNEYEIFDAEFLQKYTNAVYLVGPDEYYIRDPESSKPLVWDRQSEQARRFDDAQLGEPALDGSYKVNGRACRPAFHVLKEHVRKYTPEKVAQITTIPAETIRRVAREYGEAARVGAKIRIRDKELPWRPACVNWNRGPIAHKHGLLAGWAIQLLNAVIGAIDVPGGSLGVNVVGPFGEWGPEECPDGMIVPPLFMTWGTPPHPPRRAVSPQTYTLSELFPVTCYQCSVVPAALDNPEQFKLPYKIEMMLHVHNNYMLNSADPKKMAEIFKKVPFILTFATFMDESAEMADLVMPHPHYLERLNPCVNSALEFMLAGETDWYWMFRQPVVEPLNGIKLWTEVLLEVANRIGMKEDYYQIMNSMFRLKEPYTLDPKATYSMDELVDRYLKGMFGPEHGMEWFKEHGIIRVPKKVEEAYPRPFLKPRTPIYLEGYKRAGEDVRKVTQEMGLNWWDVSDYQVLPDWKPCPSYELKDRNFDLFVVNYKVPMHTHSYTFYNPWLAELTERYPDQRSALINTETARRKGLRDGDTVWMVGQANGNRIRVVLNVTDCVHPEVMALASTQGHWGKGTPLAKGKGPHWNTLVPYDFKYIDFTSVALDSCHRVKLEKVAE